MLYRDFINQLRLNLKKPKNKTSAYVKSLLELIKKNVEKGPVHITGVGKFYKNKNNKLHFDADNTFVKEVNIK